jgi:hypothetical protein
MEEDKTISVLLICAYPKKYRLVMKQLSQENWKVSAIGNVKKALQVIMQKPPTHVFISANTPGIALLKIAKIINSTFNLPVIIFAERQDFQTTKSLRDTKWPNIIQSSISANSIRSKIRALSGDLVSSSEKEDGIKRFSTGNGKETGAGLIKIEGKLQSRSQALSNDDEYNPEMDEMIESEDADEFGFRKKANQQMSDDLKGLSEDWDTEGLESSEDIGGDEIVSLDDEQFDVEDTEIASKLLESFNEDGESLVGEDDTYRAKKRSKEYTMEQLSDEINNELSRSDSADATPKKKNSKNISEIASELESIKAKSNAASSSSKEASQAENALDAKDDVLDTENVIPIRRSKNQPKTIVEDKASESLKKAEEETEGLDLDLKQDLNYSKQAAGVVPEKVKEAIENSLHKVVTPAAEIKREVEATSDFVAFYMQSSVFAGIIYLAVGKNDAISSGVIGPYMKCLAEALKVEKIEAYLHRPVSVQVKPLDIKLWIKENTTFHCLTSHNGDEVLIGFVSDAEVQPPFQDSEHKGMFHVDISYFPVSYPITMDLYVYLPVNKKAVKYINKNGYIDKHQKNRLTNYKHSAFHILNEDILQVRDFFIKLYTKKKVVA